MIVNNFFQVYDFSINLLFKTARGKWEQVRREVEYMFRQGRPVLVGTTR